MFKREKISGKEYLVIEIDREISDYEEQMIRKLNGKNFLSCKIDYMEQRKRFCYDISGYQQLNEYLSRNPIRMDVFKGYIVQLKQCMNLLESYMMDTHNICFYSEGIYIDSDSGLIKLSIIPAVEDNEAVRQFVNMLIKNIDINDEAVLKLAFKIFAGSLDKEFDITDLFKLIEGSSTREREIKEIPVEEKEPLKDVAEYEEKKIIEPVVQDNSGEKPKEVKKEAIPLSDRLWVKIIVSLFMLFMIMVIIAILKGREGLERAFIPYIILSVSVVLYHIVAYIAGAVKKKKRPEKNQKPVAVSGGMRLVSMESDKVIIDLPYFPFLIGSREGITDYSLLWKDVEAVHLRIEENDKGIIVTDLNTESGTFVNTKRLEKGQSVNIEPGDELIIGSHRFAFTRG